MGLFISIVVPMYFEEKVVNECYMRLTSVLEQNKINYEIIFINDGSTDNTLQILETLAIKDSRVKIINFSRNFGHQAAVTAGIENSFADAVVVIDADLQDPPELIPEMINLWENGYEVVYAKRKKRKGENWFKLITAKYFYRILSQMTEVSIPIDTGDFRLIDKKVIEEFKKMPEKNRFIRGMISWIGFKQIAIEYERDKRFAGDTKYPLKRMVKFALDGIISFSAKPLKLLGILGFSSVSISLVLLLYTITVKFLNNNDVISGWASLMTTIIFFGGVQLLSVSVLGEYVGRIYDESKNRPLYIIDKKVNF
ncbi:glycosyl transferase family 2 [Desulfofarcimen acetoxidans DSM 771]|uniref:Glycosyl transferase family 2 n=1 Tax=Desulfofarcimen acetoxidans (strain ATCC 49208 / DSM 771 / KCTC 5769 / VKM B-1644 / 5575) TaxID=485916 RepID=C8VYT0_DESAS|nr:glycosyltransferase family 2 protein [Desulfofarcimen acetoxidans]ACV64801.1 glycosyl transferase family 2 [Desulfofarcimen acetoxidans DSM 771]